jgi:hypothetical protein
MSVINTGVGTIANAQTGRVSPMLHGHIVGVFRLPTDPLFYADLTLRNVVAGSRYRVTRADTGAELATGLVSGSGLVDQVISGVACYANPQQVNITVRNASGTPKYKIFDTAAFITKSGASAYIIQIQD